MLPFSVKGLTRGRYVGSVKAVQAVEPIANIQVDLSTGTVEVDTGNAARIKARISVRDCEGCDPRT